MKEITRYQTEDGAVFDTQSKALGHEALVAECKAKVAELGLKPTPENDGCKFANGAGYVQQPAGSRDSLWGWVRHRGWNRDTGGPLGVLADRAHRMDAMDREWGQPYYAINPNKGEQREVSA